MGRISDDATRIRQEAIGEKGCRCVWFGGAERGARRDSDERGPLGWLMSTWMDEGGFVIKVRHKNMCNSLLVHASGRAYHPIAHAQVEGKQASSRNCVLRRAVGLQVQCWR